MSTLIPTTADPRDLERVTYKEFATTHAAPEYRDAIDHAYKFWKQTNETYFGGQLRVPHIGIGMTPPRRFGTCRLTTNYGGSIDITLSERIVFRTDERIVRAPWPAKGLIRFVDDLLLAELIKQYVLELLGSTEDGYGGYGPLFCAEANRIGKLLDLPPVVARRRAFRGQGLPVAAFWPWAFRPEGYYMGHVRLDHLRVAGLRPNRRVDMETANIGIYEYFLFLLATGRTARLTDILGRAVDADKVARTPAVAAFERGPHDESGMSLPMPNLDPSWITWNDGCPRAIATGIANHRTWEGMPILADALQDAGCEDELILNHCRAHATHTANCWVLKAILATETTQNSIEE